MRQGVVLVLVLAGAGAAIGLLSGGPGHPAAYSAPHPRSPATTARPSTTGTTATTATTATTVATAPTGSPAATTPSPAAGGATISALAADLRQTVAVRPSVLGAIEGVQSCQIDPTAASQTLQTAINARHTILTSLAGLPLDGVPNGTTLVSRLSAALTASIHADSDYEAWIGDVNAAGQCVPDPNQDANYQHGQAASQSADAAKSAFVGLWDAIAPTYREPTYTATQI